MQSRLCLAIIAVVAASAPALAQEGVPACESQQELEQVLQSDGELMPDGCQLLTITTIEADTGKLCVLQFEPQDPGVLETLQEAAGPSQRWVECADLTSQ